ncbi:MAG TPA: hypothetical protein VFG35_08730 [Actinoplanes sp.]|nr:hypothetical protein [Actinoplanes sp.]
MGRGQTTDEFRAEFRAQRPETADFWPYFGGNPGDPGWVSDVARACGDEYGLDAEMLDDLAADEGWEFHNAGYDAKIEQVAKWLVR